VVHHTAISIIFSITLEIQHTANYTRDSSYITLDASTSGYPLAIGDTLYTQATPAQVLHLQVQYSRTLTEHNSSVINWCSLICRPEHWLITPRCRCRVQCARGFMDQGAGDQYHEPLAVHPPSAAATSLHTVDKRGFQ
jgi:hypothetical protein